MSQTEVPLKFKGKLMDEQNNKNLEIVYLSVF